MEHIGEAEKGKNSAYPRSVGWECRLQNPRREGQGGEEENRGEDRWNCWSERFGESEIGFWQ